MWILILIVLICLSVGFTILGEKSYDYEDLFLVPALVSLIAVGFSIVGIGFTSFNVSTGRTIDKKIAMYSEENKDIEQQINQIVSNYMDYEKETFGGVNENNSMAIVTLYPELKSDKLVEEQIKTYTNNKKKLIKLKEDKINLNVSKWWLYFGGNR